MPHPVANSTDADNIIDTIAQVKSPEELDLVRRVARVADIGFEAFREYSRAGVREYELVAETEYAMRCAGADDNFILMSSGPTTPRCGIRRIACWLPAMS